MSYHWKTPFLYTQQPQNFSDLFHSLLVLCIILLDALREFNLIEVCVIKVFLKHALLLGHGPKNGGLHWI